MAQSWGIPDVTYFQTELLPLMNYTLCYPGNKLGGDYANFLYRGRNFALNGTQGDVGDSLTKKNVATQTQAEVTIYYHCIVFLLPFNGNTCCICVMANLLPM